jgi:hypothetical protein
MRQSASCRTLGCASSKTKELRRPFLLIHPTIQGADEFLYVYAQIRDLTPQEAAQTFLDWLRVNPEDILFFYESWPEGPVRNVGSPGYRPDKQ